jgi:lysine-ketoglutarate reductase/saccharopine dehydrogenase-like protein (TIGR00300 family)
MQEQFQEIVEATGHLVDSQIMTRIFDAVLEHGGRFEVQQFDIGRTNSDQSHLRLLVTAQSQQDLQQLVEHLIDLGCTPSNTIDALTEVAVRDRCAPEDFYSTTNQRTEIRIKGEWIRVEKQRMDACVVLKNNHAVCVKLRDVKQGDLIVVGMQGVRVIPESKERDRLEFSFMSNEISSERQVETAVQKTAALMRQMKKDGKRIVFVAGPVVVHTGGVGPMSQLIQAGYVDALLAGNALAVHDIEAALLGTSLGIRQKDGRQEEHGHRNHMRAINAINHCGSIAGAVEQGRLRQGIMFECVKHKVPFVLAGSLRDDGPLPDTVTDMNVAQELYTEHLRDTGLVLALSSMLHSIAVGNMLPGWVKVVGVDINPAVATKIGDRGTGQVIGVVTDVGLFLDHLSKELTKN